MRQWRTSEGPKLGHAYSNINGSCSSLLQTYQSVANGYWSARSSEFMQTNLMQTLRWMRMIGDTVFAVGAISFVYFALDLMLRRTAKVKVPVDAVTEPA